MKIPFSPPFIDDAVINEVTETLRSGWITTGPKCKALESEIQKLSGAGSVLTVNSWTSGAILVLTWLGLKDGDEVIVPAYTYSATALAVLHAGGTPVMVDVNEDFNISVEQIKKAITPRTKAIIPVDIAGYPCDYDAIMALVKSPDIIAKYEATSPIQRQLGRILVLSDAAHSIGAHYTETRRAGGVTDIAIFSLHAVKNITSAEGGAICLNLPEPFDNETLYTQLRQFSLNCQTKDAFSKSKAGGWRYDITGMGFKMNMADVNAAIALAQIRQIDKLYAERKRVFERYATLLGKYPWAMIPPTVNAQGKESSYHIFALRIKGITEEQRDQMIDLIASKEVAVNVHFIPMPMLTLFKGLGYKIMDYPQAYANYAHEISLPIYPQLTNEMADIVVDAVIKAYDHVVLNHQ